MKNLLNLHFSDCTSIHIILLLYCIGGLKKLTNEITLLKINTDILVNIQVYIDTHQMI